MTLSVMVRAYQYSAMSRDIDPGEITTWLQNKRVYPHRVASPVEVHETRISWVFLAGEYYAFKLR